MCSSTICASHQVGYCLAKSGLGIKDQNLCVPWISSGNDLSHAGASVRKPLADASGTQTTGNTPEAVGLPLIISSREFPHRLSQVLWCVWDSCRAIRGLILCSWGSSTQRVEEQREACWTQGKPAAGWKKSFQSGVFQHLKPKCNHTPAETYCSWGFCPPILPHFPRVVN